MESTDGRERNMYDVTAEVRTDDGSTRVVCGVPLPVAPEVVWDAVATAEGIASWFVSCAMEPRVGGRIVQFADPGAPDPTTGPEAAAEAMLTATVGEITEYTPPTAGAPGRFAYVERDWMGEGVPVPPWETSCEVDDDEGGSVLTLRSGFASVGELAEQSVSGSVDGWAQALTVLAHRLTHRPADGVVTVDAATDPVQQTVPELWARVTSRLIAPAAGAGHNPAGGPGGGSGNSGVVARSGEVGGIVVTESEASRTLILSAPVDGMLELFAFPAGETHEDAAGRAALALRVYEYVDAPGGDGRPLGAAAVDVTPTWDAPRWRTWLDGLLAD
ncbi:MAG: SRPBCC domain-containing protein [Dietzia sp.]